MSRTLEITLLRKETEIYKEKVAKLKVLFDTDIKNLDEELREYFGDYRKQAIEECLNEVEIAYYDRKNRLTTREMYHFDKNEIDGVEKIDESDGNIGFEVDLSKIPAGVEIIRFMRNV